MSEEVLSGAAAEHSGTRSRGQGLEQRRSRSRSRDRESIVKESIRGGTETDETLLGSVDRNEQPEQSVVPADGGTIYVANLDHVTTHESLAMAFAQDIGPVANAIVMMEPHTNTSRGFGFVTFTTTADFDKAITSQGQMMVDGRVVKISNANRAQPYEKTPGKFMGGRNPLDRGGRGGRGGRHSGGRNSHFDVGSRRGDGDWDRRRFDHVGNRDRDRDRDRDDIRGYPGGPSYQQYGQGFEADHNFDHRNRGFDYRNQGRGRGFDHHDRGFDNRDRSYDHRNQGYDSRGRGFDHRNQGYDHGNEGYGSRERNVDNRDRDFDGRGHGQFQSSGFDGDGHGGRGHVAVVREEGDYSHAAYAVDGGSGSARDYGGGRVYGGRGRGRGRW